MSAIGLEQRAPIPFLGQARVLSPKSPFLGCRVISKLGVCVLGQGYVGTAALRVIEVSQLGIVGIYFRSPRALQIPIRVLQ